MSKTETPTRTNLRDLEEADVEASVEDEFETLPTIVGLDAAAAFLNSKNVPITGRYVKEGVAKGHLKSFIIARRLCFSEADLIAWIRDLRR